MLYPIELRAQAKPAGDTIGTYAPTSITSRPRRRAPVTSFGRGRGIRTPDTLLPKQVRYQAALYPAVSLLRSLENAPKRRTSLGVGVRQRQPSREIDRVVTTPSAEPSLAGTSSEHAALECGGKSKREAFLPPFCFVLLARPERFELPTTKFVAWYSIQLSYGRVVSCCIWLRD